MIRVRLRVTVTVRVNVLTKILDEHCGPFVTAGTGGYWFVCSHVPAFLKLSLEP